MKRILCMYFPQWPIQRRMQARPELRDKVVVITTPTASRRPEVLQCSVAAMRAGIRPGRPLAEALATEPGLCACEEDLVADRRRLELLAERMNRYSPCVGLEDGPAPECLLADITGCGAVFKGEDRLLEQAVRELHAAGWTARLAIADTIGAAWALAHHARPCPAPQGLGCNRSPLSPLGRGAGGEGTWTKGSDEKTSAQVSQSPSPPAPIPSGERGGNGYDSPPGLLAPPGSIETFLPDLPVVALRLAPEIVTLLQDLGVMHIRDLLALPREEVPARFGAEVLRRLDQARGRAAEVIRPCRLLGDIEATHRFEYAVDRPEVLRFVLERLTQEVQAALAARGWGARQLECRLQHESAAVSKLEVSLFRPSHAFAHLWGLLRTRLEQARVAEPVSALTLRVVSGEPVAEVQAEFVDEDQTAARREMAILIDRLSSRLGREAVTRPTLVPDPQPEFACRFEPVIHAQEPRPALDPDLLAATPQGCADAAPRNDAVPRTAPAHPCGIAAKRAKTKVSLFLSLSSARGPRFAHRPLHLWPAPARIEVLRVVPGGLPARFRWEGHDFSIARAWGPERIDTGWWRGDDVHRDYYVVATQTGTRFWLFHRRDDDRWFLHGCFD
jgi:protein ImuB